MTCDQTEARPLNALLVRFVAIACTLSLGCGSTTSGSVANEDAGPADGGSDSPVGEGGVTNLGSVDGSQANSRCNDRAKLIYVAAGNASGTVTELHSFDSATLTFARIPTSACGGDGGAFTANSMTVDRDGNVYFATATSLVKVSSSDGSCLGTIPLKLPTSTTITSIAFGGKAEAEDETLFALIDGSTALGTVDRATGVYTPIGGDATPGRRLTPLLTAAGDGRLFLDQTDANGILGVAEIDVRTASLTPRFTLPTATEKFAPFVFYGGDFVFFRNVGSIEVGRYRVSESRYEVLVARAEVLVQAAGVSVCAPVTSIR